MWSTIPLGEVLKKLNTDLNTGLKPEINQSNADEPVTTHNEDEYVGGLTDDDVTVKIGDVYVLGNHRLMCGDSCDRQNIDILIDKDKIDLILTDPPYNLANYSTGNMKFEWRAEINNDVAEWDEKPLNPSEFANEFKRILKPTGNIFIFCSYNLLGEYHKSLDPLFNTFQFMVWHKTNPIPILRGLIHRKVIYYFALPSNSALLLLILPI